MVQKADDEYSANGGGILRFEKGVYVLSTVFLNLNVTIEIPEWCVFEDYPCTHYLGGAGLVSTL